jgi:hypothetical protein
MQVRCLSIELHDRITANCSDVFYAAMKETGFARRNLGRWHGMELEVWCRLRKMLQQQ